MIPSKSLTLKTIKKVINDNSKDNISINAANTINVSNVHSYKNKNNLNKNEFSTISAEKISNSVFHNYNRLNSKQKNFRKTMGQYENSKGMTNEVDNMSNNYNNVKILASLMKNNTSDKLKNFTNININYLYKYNNKNIINLNRFNNSFRIQMNHTCLKFIPHSHLKKLNDQQRDNSIVRKSMENIKHKISLKLKDFTDKKSLFKKYQKIVKEFRNEKNKRILSARKLTTYPDKIPNNIKFIPGKYFSPFGFKTRALYEHNVHSLENERHKQRMIIREKKNEPQKNIKKNEFLLDKALKKLNNSLNIKNIHKYINDKKEQKIKITDLNEERNKYFPMLKEADDYIQNFDINKLNEKYKIKETNKNFLELDEDNIELEKNILQAENELRKLRI